MAKKAELLAKAKEMNLEVTDKDTVTQIETAISDAEKQNKTGKKNEKLAKSGKRSAKSLAESEEKEAKQARKNKSSESEENNKPKQPQNIRTILERRGKNFRKAAEKIEKDKQYTIIDALGLAIATSTVKFDATVEIHLRLNVDPRQADQNIRDTIVLPSGTGKSLKVAVFADTEDLNKAKKAGADIAKSDEFLQQLDKGIIDFDVLISTPAMMAKLGKYARVLGPKGLMPNPKSGTVTNDLENAVKEAKAGRVEYRVDSTGIIHVGIGKVSFGKDKLLENTKALLASVKSNKPSSIKGSYMKSLFITTSMGPGIPVDTNESN